MVSSTVPMLGAHVLDARHHGIKMSRRNCDLVSACSSTFAHRNSQIEVAAIIGPVGVGIVLMLPKGPIMSGIIAQYQYPTGQSGFRDSKRSA